MSFSVYSYYYYIIEKRIDYYSRVYGESIKNNKYFNKQILLVICSMSSD